MNYIKQLILFVLLFILICKPEFTFIPLGINRFFGLLGMLIYFADKKTARCITGNYFLTFKPFWRFLFPVLIAAIVSFGVNFSSDFYFPKYVISLFLAFFATYLWVWGVYKSHGTISVSIIMKYYIAVVSLYVTIALVCFINPELLNILASLQRLNEGAESAMDRAGGTRLIGIGANYFTSSLINGTFLILFGFYIKTYQHKLLANTLLIILFIYISVLSLMMARTAMFGMILGGAIALYGLVGSFKQFFRIVMSLVLGSISLYYGILLFAKDYATELDVLTSFGFEMFINANEGGRVESHSMLLLYEMWATLPTELSTWIIGDAKWDGENGTYYMSVDLGYFRALFYFGLVGTFLLFRFYYLTIRRIIVQNKIFSPYSKLCFWALLVFVLIVNAKGPGDIYFYILPFYFVSDKFLIKDL